MDLDTVFAKQAETVQKSYRAQLEAMRSQEATALAEIELAEIEAIADRYAPWYPPLIWEQIWSDLGAARRFFADLKKHESESDDGLVETAQICLRNLSSIGRYAVGDDLRAAIVPEICERIVPGSRTPVRRITTCIAERDDGPRFDSRLLEAQGFSAFWRRHYCPPGTAARARHDAQTLGFAREATGMRARIVLLAEISVNELIDRAKEAIGQSSVHVRWSPTTFVYEPALTYRVIPVLGHRAMLRAQGRP